MANAQYHKLPSGEYMNLGAPGAPAFFKVAMSNDGLWYPQFTWNGADWFLFVPPAVFTTPAQAQASLDTFITNFLAGNIGT
jgi:hypothetical protein